MSHTFSMPQDMKIVSGTTPVTTNGAKVGDYISLKNCHRVFVVFKLTQAVGHATICGINRATAVAPTGATAMTETVPIWLNEDTATSDTLVRQTDAATQAVAADVLNKMVVMQIDPEALAATFDCIAGTTDNSGQATNFVDITYYAVPRYAQATPPTMITD
jgi:hypothetical protein